MIQIKFKAGLRGIKQHQNNALFILVDFEAQWGTHIDACRPNNKCLKYPVQNVQWVEFRFLLCSVSTIFVWFTWASLLRVYRPCLMDFRLFTLQTFRWIINDLLILNYFSKLKIGTNYFISKQLAGNSLFAFN